MILNCLNRKNIKKRKKINKILKFFVFITFTGFIILSSINIKDFIKKFTENNKIEIINKNLKLN